MLTKSILVSALATTAVAADEHILGVYMFHRHGDRTPKVLPPVGMTSLGGDEVFQSGGFFRNRYISSGDFQIAGISSAAAKLSQLSVTAPVDAVLQNSAMAFVQGLYPPSTDDTAQTLANKTKISAPLSGYQYIPVEAVAQAASNSKSESNAFLQSGSGCSKALASSNGYLQSAEFNKTADQSKSFYQGLEPILNRTFKATDVGFSSAYTIFDYINVATIHNETYPGQSLITNSTYSQLINLASIHEWNLAYNSSDPVRAISGSILAGQTVTALQAVIDDVAAKKTAAPRFNVQFGAYGTFMAFFGLAGLPAVNPDFYGICDYASSMAFELVAPTVDAKESDISVRFLFANGTAAYHEFKPYPLFGQDKTTLPWADFKTGISKIAVTNNQQWCDTCGNTSGACAPNSTASTTSQSSGSGSGSGVSRPVAGVIGALVTLVVILGAQALVMLVGGVRFAKKSTLARANQSTGAASAGKA